MTIKKFVGIGTIDFGYVQTRNVPGRWECRKCHTTNGLQEKKCRGCKTKRGAIEGENTSVRK